MVFFIGWTFFFSHQKKNQKGWCFSWYRFAFQAVGSGARRSFFIRR